MAGYGNEGFGLDSYGSLWLPTTALPEIDFIPLTPTTVLAVFYTVSVPPAGILFTGAWAFTSAYPISLVCTNVVWPYLGNNRHALLTVKGMTTVYYTGEVTVP